METKNTAERPHYDSWAECESCNQDRLKKWYDTKTGYRVLKRIPMKHGISLPGA